ncbi:MAG: DUF3990 domain-containing protein [Lachnospiraceae bacterium]|nr:DUF3990 domain-containing protein [Lachnospiraceae bacterium]
MCGKIILYHGSQFIIDKPLYGGGKQYNDYGQGFYLTREAELAKEWACTDESNGYVNRYELDLSDLTIINLSDDGYNILNWIAILLNNRVFRITNEIAFAGKEFLLKRFLPDVESCDIIIGNRADDSYFAFAGAFLNNGISLSKLEEAMKLGKLGEQTVLKSKAAFKKIKYLDHEISAKEVYFPKKCVRDKEARTEFFQIKSDLRLIENEIFLIDIIRERWENSDERLCRNLS